MSIENIAKEVKLLHEKSSNECLREWFFEGHVQAVVEHVKRICKRENIASEIPILAALLHDIARTTGFNNEPELMDESLRITVDMLEKYEYEESLIKRVCEIIKNHSCRGGAVPENIEAKAMVTADAMAHLMTDFYFVLPVNGWLTAADSFDGWKEWMMEKVERDFKVKILFEVDKNLAKPRYEALRIIFA